MEKTKKGDFIEIDYIGYANREIFDTNIKSEAEKINLGIEVKPLIVCIGQEMVVKGFDRQLEGKELGKKYKISINPEEGFGKRNPSLIKTIPLSAFKQQEMSPAPGMILNLDGMIAKILSVSGGRVITDFNNPLAGKDIEYEFTIKKIITDDKEKVDSLQDFFFKKRFKFKIEEKKIVFESEAEPFVKILGKRLKDIIGKEIEFESSLETSETKVSDSAQKSRISDKTSEKTAKAKAHQMTEGKEKKVKEKNQETKVKKENGKKGKNHNTKISSK